MNSNMNTLNSGLKTSNRTHIISNWDFSHDKKQTIRKDAKQQVLEFYKKKNDKSQLQIKTTLN